MKINLVFISTIFIFFFSCDSSNELVSQDLNGKKSLVTKTIYIDQIIPPFKKSIETLSDLINLLLTIDN